MSQTNNFGIVRLTAAVMVFTGHLYVLMGREVPVILGTSLHALGVRILFSISGYLIAISWMRDPHPLRYALRRFFRLWPPFAMSVLLITFAFAPWFSELGVKGYFAANFTEYLKNLRFYIVYGLPGVFGSLPYPNAVNGSFWTMPVEAFAYILLPIALTIASLLSKKHRAVPLAVFVVLLEAIDLWLIYTGNTTVIYNALLGLSVQLLVFFIAGAAFAQPEMKKFLSLQAAIACIVVYLIFVRNEWLKLALLPIVLPYFIISFAQAEKPIFSTVGKKIDPSYGIYLYGFFFQQCIIQLREWHNLPWNYGVCFILSLIPTVIAGVLSYHFVEVPCMKLGRKIISALMPH